MHRILFFKLIVFVLLGLFVSCSDSDNKTNTYGNADLLPGNWVVTQKYFQVISSEGDKTQDDIADVIKPLNNLFKGWIANAQVQLKYSTLAYNDSMQVDVGTFYERIDSINTDGVSILIKNYNGGYAVTSNEDVTIEYETEIVGYVWSSSTKIGVHGNSFYMKQKLDSKGLEAIWKLYGGGNRTFADSEQVTMITRASRVQ